MREFFDRMNLRIAEFMEGRYGMDSLNKFLLVVAIIILLITSFIPFASLLGWVFVAIAAFRALSKNHEARMRANDKFEQIISGPKRAFKHMDQRYKNRKTTVYFKCKGCGTRLSLPKGKGKLRVVCPKCKKEIFKTT